MVEIPQTVLESDLFVSNLEFPEELQDFICGDNDLDDFLQSNALMACNEGTSKTHLVYYKNVTLVGFFSLCNDILKRDQIIHADDKALNFDPVEYPALKIVRLATHKDWSSRGIGRYMLKYSISIAKHLSKKYSGCRFITVDAYQDRITFYTDYGFKLIESTSKKKHPKLYVNHVVFPKK